MTEPGLDPAPKDKGGKKPKDSEFYEIPPDLKGEFDMLMSGKPKGAVQKPKFEEATRSRTAKQKHAKLSVIFGVLGGFLLFAGPALAITFGFMARRNRGGDRDAPSGPDMAVVGIALGFLMLAWNVLLILILLKAL